MSVWVTGANGQVGQSLMQLAREGKNAEFLFLSRSALDLTCSKSIYELSRKKRPSCIINLAAYTDVNRAENDKNTALLVNSTAVKYLATIAEHSNAAFIQLSTDYVFDGTKTRPYSESDNTNPLNVYGETKLLGEAEVQTICSRHLIVRTSWVFSEFKKNFVTTIAHLLLTRPELSVANDQLGGPTSAKSLAELIRWLALEKIEEASFGKWGIYHFSQEPFTTWFNFSKTIQLLLHDQLPSNCNLIPCNSKDQIAKRPTNSCLDSSKIQALGFQRKPWSEELERVLDRVAVQLKKGDDIVPEPS